MNSAYKIAIACWAVPLIVGLSVFFIWVQTDYTPLMGVGITTIIAGLLLFFVGVYSAIRGHNVARDSIVESPSITWNLTLPICVLLLSNFFVASVIVILAFGIYTSCRVEIKNDSDAHIVDCRVQVNGTGPIFGNIPPGTSVRKRFDVPGEGELVLKASWNGQDVEQVVQGYVTRNLGGNKTAVFNQDGTVTVIDNRK